MAPSERTRVTPAGAWCLGAAAAAVAVGTVTGLTELFLCGVFLLALVAAAVVLVGAGRLDVSTRRTITPRRLVAGDDCTVHLALEAATRQSPLPIDIDDHFDGAAIMIGATRVSGAGQPSQISYRIATTRRGIGHFGPVLLRRTDPFGLATRRRILPDELDVFILPRIVLLDAVPAPVRDPLSGTRHERSSSTPSDEFDALRDYVPGDDVRRVHWPSTARLGRPVVRNHEQSWQQHTTVVLDTSAAEHVAGADDSRSPRDTEARTSDDFERAVSAAASVLYACHRSGDAVRLITGSGTDTGFLHDTAQVAVAIDSLATVERRTGDRVAGALRLATHQHDASARLVLCSAGISAGDLGVLRGHAASTERSVLISCADTGESLAPSFGRLAAIRFGPLDDLANEWRRVTAGAANAGAFG